jgi:surface polysaccharide O-acyltransferase-like enzyme
MYLIASLLLDQNCSITTLTLSHPLLYHTYFFFITQVYLIASLLLDQNEVKGAEAMFRRALAGYEKVLGAYDQVVATAGR